MPGSDRSETKQIPATPQITTDATWSLPLGVKIKFGKESEDDQLKAATSIKDLHRLTLLRSHSRPREACAGVWRGVLKFEPV